MGVKVLLVESDATSGAELGRALVGHGYDVTVVRDGQLGLARAVSERFDAVVVSAELRGINGFRICNRIRKDPNVGAVRIFILGAEPADLAAHERLPTHADSYFQRPVIVDELVARMRLHGVADAPPAGARVGLEADIASARKDLATIAELRGRVAEQDALLEQTTRELSKARADILRATPARDGSSLRPRTTLPKPTEKRPPEGGPTLEAQIRSLEQRLEERSHALSEAEKTNKRLLAERDLARKEAAGAGAARTKLDDAAGDRSRAERAALEAQLRSLEQAAKAALEEERRRANEATAAAIAERDRADEATARVTAELEAAQRHHANALAARDQTHAHDIMLATRAIAQLRQDLAARESARALLEKRLAETDVEADRREAATRWATDRAVLEERLRMAEAHGDEVAVALVAARAALTATQGAASSPPAHEREVERLEAALVSRAEAITQLERELDEAHREVPALEAEIVVLRSELMNLRRERDTQILRDQAADEQLERGKDLLARAEALLRERGD